MLNVIVPKVNDPNDFTEIDMVVITTKDIYIVEAKNRAGSISGNALEPTWKQRIGNTTNDVYNPILQNQNHAIALYNYWKSTLNMTPDFLPWNVLFFADSSFSFDVNGVIPRNGACIYALTDTWKFFDVRNAADRMPAWAVQKFADALYPQSNFTEGQRSQMFAERENWKSVMPGDDTRFIVYVEGTVRGGGSDMQSIWPEVKLFRYNSNGVAAYRDDGVGFWYPDVIRTERVAWYSGQSYEWEKICGRSDTKWMIHNYREAMRIYQNMKNELTDSIEFRTTDELGQYLSRRFGPCYIALYQ